MMTTEDPQAPATGPDAATVLASDWPSRAIKRINGVRLDRYQAVVRRVALDAVHGHGKSITAAEVCGVLVGNVYRDHLGPYLYISDAIRGDRANGLAAQVTFTAETWAEIQAVMDREHPDKRIVGWYHTHPGFGIFLSGMDLFIQDHFFNLPWQVALVYDPIGGDEGMFFWREGKADRQPFLIEDEDIRDHAPTMAELESAQLSKSDVIARRPVAQLPPEPAPAEASAHRWTPAGAIEPRKFPAWLIGLIAFVISFGCTLWAMYSMNQVVTVPQHIEHSQIVVPIPAQGDK